MEPERVSFTVEVDRPEGVSVARLREYLEENCFAFVGSLSPENPLFYLEQSSIKVSKHQG